jgi:DtxR family Mn-dependent transcriptional regulator
MSARAVKQAVELTAPVEDYLKAVYELETAGEPAETNAIAELLAIAPASVSGMIRRLSEQGLVTHERYHGARLTHAGRRAALKTVRRHRVIEAYLTKALDYSWDLVHDEAERLEHAASDELIDRMARAIGEPETDPHGAPIPTREGTLREAALVALSSLNAGDTVRVDRVSDRSGEQLRYLAQLGIVPGVVIRVIAREPFEGALQLRVANRTRSLGSALAADVLVKPIRPRRAR